MVGNFPVGSYVRCIALSRDKSSLLVGCQDGDAMVMDVITGQIRHVCKGHTGTVRCIIAGSGNEIITCSADMSIKRWTSEGVCVRTYLEHSDDVNSLLFSEKRNCIYSAGYEPFIRALDYDSGVEVAKMLVHERCVTSISWVKGEETFVYGSGDNSIRLWDATGMTLIKVIGSHKSYVNSVAASHDGRYVVSGGWDNKVNIWDVETSQLVRSFSPHNDWVTKVSLSPDGAFLGSGCRFDMFQIHKIDPALSMVINEGILSTSTHARKNVRLFSDSIIRESDTLRIVATITSLTTCRMISDSTFKLESNNNNNNNNTSNKKKGKIGSNKEALELTAPSPSSAHLWVEAICAMRHNLSLGDDDNPQASQIIPRYRFDTLQLIWFHTGPFGLRVPKTVIELIGSYLLGNGGGVFQFFD
jgi:WD40 repeat protein